MCYRGFLAQTTVREKRVCEKKTFREDTPDDGRSNLIYRDV